MARNASKATVSSRTESRAKAEKRRADCVGGRKRRDVRASVSVQLQYRVQDSACFPAGLLKYLKSFRTRPAWVLAKLEAISLFSLNMDISFVIAYARSIRIDICKAILSPAAVLP
jgi:hypothetical protein